MSAELHDAVEHLYEVFARYSRPPSVEGCPCCVSESDRARLHRAPLRGLEGDDLRRFAFNALTTWGDERDFRHFLPRILELVAHPDDPLGVDSQVVLGKLPYGHWESWPDEERAAIDRWMDAWWVDTLTQAAAWRTPDVLASILLTGRELGPLLEVFERELARSAVTRAASLELLQCAARSPSFDAWTPVEVSRRVADWLVGCRAHVERAIEEARDEDPDYLHTVFAELARR